MVQNDDGEWVVNEAYLDGAGDEDTGTDEADVTDEADADGDYPVVENVFAEEETTADD
jgi:hypothetical protein